MAVVDIKGQNNGLVFVFRPGTIDEYITELKNRFDSNPALFRGFSVTFRGEALKNLSSEELGSLQRLCLDYGLTLALPPTSRTTRERDAEGSDIIVKRTLRSGQKIIHDGSIVILGMSMRALRLLPPRTLLCWDVWKELYMPAVLATCPALSSP